MAHIYIVRKTMFNYYRIIELGKLRHSNEVMKHKRGARVCRPVTMTIEHIFIENAAPVLNGLHYLSS